MRISAQLLLAAVASLVSSASVDLEKRDSPLDVQIAAISNTMLKATVTNNGATDLNLLNRGTFLDPDPVEKVAVFTKDSRVAFDGIRYRIAHQNLSSASFTPLKAGESLEVQWDMGAVHDLSTGGIFHALAYGAIPYAEVGSTQLSGKAVSFKSNTLNLNVDGKRAALVPRAVDVMKNDLSRRTALSSDCTGTKSTASRNALTQCARLANQAATAATSGSASKFQEYFKTTSPSTRSTVAARLKAVANECSSTTSGATQTHCADTYNACSSGTLAYTLPSRNYVVNCPIYFTYLPLLTTTCHDQDQATTTLHEMTHAPGVYSPGTDDVAYGYSASVSLSTSQALDNADTFALYANAIDLKC